MATLDRAFSKCQGYIASHLEGADKEGRRKAGERLSPSVTLSRMTGAGAVSLSHKLADYLTGQDRGSKIPWTVFDKDLVAKVLEDHNLPARLERFMPEDKPPIVEEAFSGIMGLRPSDWTLFRHVCDTIYRLAKMGNVILVGRGANIITRSLPNVFSIRIIGSLEKRVVRCRALHDLSEKEARDFIRKEDRARRRYLRAYFDKDIDNPLHYHMVVNLDHFTEDQFAALVGDMVLRFREKLQDM